MKRLFNVDHQPAVIAPDRRAVMPGEAHVFTDEQATGLSGRWSERDPREGLAAEKRFKRRRDQLVATESESPAEPESDMKETVV